MTTQNIYDLVDTWNAGATTFTAIKMNVTDTASASGSLLMDLQVGTVSKFAVRKDGSIVLPSPTIFIGSTGSFATGSPGSSTTTLLTLDTTNTVTLNQNRLAFGGDAFIIKVNTATLQLGNSNAASPTPQTLQVQSVSAGTTNAAGATFTISGSRGTGTGAGGSIVFQVASAGSTGSSQNALAAALTITSAKEIKCFGPLWLSAAYTAGDPVTTGYLTLYDSNGTAYKVPALAA